MRSGKQMVHTCKMSDTLAISVTRAFMPCHRWTSTRTTPRSSCASHRTTPTCSPTSAGSGSRTHTSSACWQRWAAPQSSDTGCGTSSSCSSTTPMPEVAARCLLAAWPADASEAAWLGKRLSSGSLTGWRKSAQRGWGAEFIDWT